MMEMCQPYTKLVSSNWRRPFYVSKINGTYYPYKTKWNAFVGTISQELLAVFSQDQLKDLYDRAPTLSDYE